MLPLHALVYAALMDGPPLEPLTVEDKFGRPRFIVPDAPSRSTTRATTAPREAAAPASRPTKCPPNMVYIAGGEFSNRPMSAFCLDRHEVTVGNFADHLAAVEKRGEMTKRALGELKRSLETVDWPKVGAADTRDRNLHCTWRQARNSPDLPINCVSYAEAEAYCAAQGKRLPSEREWRWAARGRRADWTYPWGKRGPASDYANMADPGSQPQLAPVCSLKPSGGLHDMGGNVWEWVTGDLGAIEYAARGGGFRTELLREMKVTAERRVETRNARSDDVGFRCVAPVVREERRP